MTRTACLALAAATLVLGAACGGSSPPARCADPLLIDDMEDGDRFICESGGRHGAWYALKHDTSTNTSPPGEFTPASIPGGRGASGYAAHFMGFDVFDQGAMGFSLDGEGAAAQPFDASFASGIKFWMKSNAPVIVEFPIPETIPPDEPAGTCTAPGNCDNHFRFSIAAPAQSGWTEYSVPFTALKQDYKSAPDVGVLVGTAQWDPAQLVKVQFNAGPDPFDVWIDDVRFDQCSGSVCAPTCTDPAYPVACPATTTAPASCRLAGTTCALTDFPGVWGTGPNDVWAVGSGGTILHWDGDRLSSFPSGTTEWLSEPRGSGPNDVWAVGSGGAIVHWDGSAWSPVPSGTTSGLFGVWGAAVDDAWAVGAGGTILHWDGAAWSAEVSPTTASLFRVWGSGPNDVWAVGSNGSAGIVVRWDGSAWGLTSAPAPLTTRGVGGSGPDDVWVSGGNGAIIHWNGSAWATAPTPVSPVVLYVSASARDDAWAVGNDGTILRWNGLAWTAVPSGSTAFLVGIWANGPNDAWAAGWGGTILHWDGTAWSPVPTGVP
jgi:hypothetical protein